MSKINPDYVRSTLNTIKDDKHLIKWVTRNKNNPIYIETKYDGECCFVQKENDEIFVSNKGKTTYDKKYFLDRGHDDFYNNLLNAIEHDGVYKTEFIAGHGKVDEFNLYQSAIADADKGTLQAIVYDVIIFGDVDISNEPLSKRKDVLIQGLNQNDSCMLADSWEVEANTTIEQKMDKINDTFDVVTENGYEGIILKSDTGDWIKKKVTRTIDAVVIGVKKTKEYIQNGTGRSFLLGLLEDDKFRIIGAVSSGFAIPDLDFMRKNTYIQNSFNVTNPDSTKLDDYVALEPEICLEIDYLSMGAKLRQPRMMRIRHDKTKDTCKVDQVC
jgi:bifunctional non-homologous end joining protein LigD